MEWDAGRAVMLWAATSTTGVPIAPSLLESCFATCSTLCAAVSAKAGRASKQPTVAAVPANVFEKGGSLMGRPMC